jgi:hypothetical protein
VIAVALLVGGCGTPPWQQAASPAPATSGSDAATASPSATPAPSSTPPSSTPPSSTAPTAAPEVENDLSKGSLKRTLTAGAAELKVTYWSTLDLGDWVPQVPKPVNVVASARLDGGARGQIASLSAVRVASTAVAADGSPTVLDPVQDKAQVKPGYLVSAPSSYQQVFSIPPAPAGCTAVQLTITYELLIQAAPDSTTYLRQATSDTIQVPLVS